MKKALIALAVLGFGSACSADPVVFNDFSSTAGLTRSGSAASTSTPDGAVLRLVSATAFDSGSAFSTATINAATFSTFFRFRISGSGGIGDGDGPGADGLVFVVQSVSANIGGAGGGIGYQGINPSVGVEFDTYDNGTGAGDPNGNHIGIDLNGSVASINTLAVAPRFNDGNIWNVWVDYNGTTLEVRANETGIRPAAPDLSQVINIPTILGQDSAYVGFTAGTGSGYGNHDILNWQYNDSFAPIDSAAPLPGTLTAGITLLGGTFGLRRVHRSRRKQ